MQQWSRRLLLFPYHHSDKTPPVQLVWHASSPSMNGYGLWGNHNWHKNHQCADQKVTTRRPDQVLLWETLKPELLKCLVKLTSSSYEVHMKYDTNVRNVIICCPSASSSRVFLLVQKSLWAVTLQISWTCQCCKSVPSDHLRHKMSKLTF